MSLIERRMGIPHMKKRELMKGCEAVAEAAVRAGCRFYSGYPITPQTEISEYLAQALPENGGVFIQGESELASINMVLGAAATGTRAMTSSSSPGISLMTEGISFLAGLRLPAVIINAMRGGPAIGSLQTAQSDYFQATKAAGHGGFRMMVLAPCCVQEAADLVYRAFEYADRDRNPVLVLMDACIASITESVVLPPAVDLGTIKKEWAVRGKGKHSRHMIAPDGGMDPEKLQESNIQSAVLYKNWEHSDVQVEEYRTSDAEIIISAYGTAGRISRGAVKRLREMGIKAGLIRPITVSPFPYNAFKELKPDQVKFVLNVEMTIPAQMGYDVRLYLPDSIPMYEELTSGGIMVDINNIVDKVVFLMQGGLR